MPGPITSDNPGAPLSAAVAQFEVSQASIGSRSSLSPGQASLGPVTKASPGEGARCTRPLPAHTHTARACLSSARAPTTLSSASPRWGSRPTKPSNATTRMHASVVCRSAAWAPHTLPYTRGCQSCRQAPQGRSSPAPLQVRQGSRPRPRSATCGLRSCSRQRGAHSQGAPLALPIQQHPWSSGGRHGERGVRQEGRARRRRRGWGSRRKNCVGPHHGPHHGA